MKTTNPTNLLLFLRKKLLPVVFLRPCSRIFWRYLTLGSYRRKLYRQRVKRLKITGPGRFETYVTCNGSLELKNLKIDKKKLNLKISGWFQPLCNKSSPATILWFKTSSTPAGAPKWAQFLCQIGTEMSRHPIWKPIYFFFWGSQKLLGYYTARSRGLVTCNI